MATTGRTGGHQRGDLVAAYGEVFMATVIEPVSEPVLGETLGEVAVRGSSSTGPCRPDLPLDLGPVAEPVLGPPRWATRLFEPEHVTRRTALARRTVIQPRARWRCRAGSRHLGHTQVARIARGSMGRSVHGAILLLVFGCSSWYPFGTRFVFRSNRPKEKARISGPFLVAGAGFEPATFGL